MWTNVSFMSVTSHSQGIFKSHFFYSFSLRSYFPFILSIQLTHISIWAFSPMGSWEGLPCVFSICLRFSECASLIFHIKISNRIPTRASFPLHTPSLSPLGPQEVLHIIINLVISRIRLSFLISKVIRENTALTLALSNVHSLIVILVVRIIDGSPVTWPRFATYILVYIISIRVTISILIIQGVSIIQIVTTRVRTCRTSRFTSNIGMDLTLLASFTSNVGVQRTL